MLFDTLLEDYSPLNEDKNKSETTGTTEEGDQTDTAEKVLELFDCFHLGLHMRKPVFGVSEKARLKPISSATETS